MIDKTYLVKLKPPALCGLIIVAASAEIHDEHLVLLNAHGKLCALLLYEIVESWTEISG